MGRRHSRRQDFSQNFLYDRSLIRRLVHRSGIAEDDLVLEVGPGNGSLTAELLRQARQVLAVEVDSRLVDRLRARFAHERGLILFAGDFLDFPLPQTPYKVFASLPYRHTAAIVGKLTTGVAPPTDMFLVMQVEAARRFMGDPQGTMIAAQLAPWFELEIIHQFRRSDFRPAPAVDSVMMHMHHRESPLVCLADRERYIHLVSGTYSAWQPTVETALASLLSERTRRALRGKIERSFKLRPSRLAIKDWIALFDVVNEEASASDWERLEVAHRRLQVQQSTLQRPTQTQRDRVRRPAR